MMQESQQWLFFALKNFFQIASCNVDNIMLQCSCKRVTKTTNKLEAKTMETFYAKILAKAGYRPINWYVAKETTETVTFYHWAYDEGMQVTLPKH